MEDINLDFLLKTPPRQGQDDVQTTSPFVYNAIDVTFGKKKKDSKKFKMAQRIAKVDELVQEINQLKSQNVELNQQLRDFKTTAQKVQELYAKEKEKHSKVKSSLENLQKQYNKIDEDLTNTTMVIDQLNGRLEEQDGRPISYNNLVIKYVRIVSRLEGDDLLKYFAEKDLVEKLREYCESFRLKLPQIKSPKKSRVRENKAKSSDMFVQCDLTEEIPLQKLDCPICKNKPKMQDQSIQHATVKCEKGSQYISTMITRQTNTEKIVKKHVQTMFPEPPAIDEIIDVYARWSDIRSVSPLLESPLRVCRTPSEEVLKKFSTTGTCTMLCNIRRKIDYLPPNNSSNIKEEVYTPSVSPTLNSYTTTTTRSKENLHLNNAPDNINSNLKLNFFNSTINSSLGQLSSNAFNELWQIFGKMLLSLLQNSNAGIANTIQNSALNQQQFLDWLLDMFVNFQSQTTSTVQAQTSEKNVPSHSSVSTSPLIFNDASVLLTNVVRPEPQKTLTPKTNAQEKETNVCLNLSSIDNNNILSPTCTSNTPLQSFSQDSNSMDSEVLQIEITSNTMEFQATNSCVAKLQEKQLINTTKQQSKSAKELKTTHQIIDRIQELLPEVKLNNKKRKALKRLLKNNNHRKKSFENRKNIIQNVMSEHTSPIVIVANESLSDDTTETAIDFLKTFAIEQESNQPLEENISETEKIFIKQISNNNLNKPDEFTFTKPCNNLSQSRAVTKLNSNTFVKQPIKLKNSKDKNQLKNNFQLLFGDSDNEFEEHEMEMENSEIPKSVIQITPNSSSESNNRYINQCTDSMDDSMSSQEFHQIQQQFPFTFENIFNRNSSQVTPSLSNEPMSIIANLQNTFEIQQVVNNKSSEYFYLDNDKQGFETSSDSSKHYINECTESTNQNLAILDLNQLQQQQIPCTNKPMAIFDNSPNRTFSQETLLISHDPKSIQNSFDIHPANAYIQSFDPSSTKNVNNCSLIYIDNSMETDLDLSSNYNNTEEEEVYEHASNKETATTKELKYLHDNRKSNSPSFERINNKKTDNFYITSVSTLKESTVKVDEKLVTTSMPKQNYDDDLCSNNSLEEVSNHQVAPAAYPNDFEKDFELSSDNESFISENELNNTTYCSPTKTTTTTTIEKPKYNEFNNLTLNSKSECTGEMVSHEQEKKDLISIKNIPAKQPKKYNQLDKWETSFASFISNLSYQTKSSFGKTVQLGKEELKKPQSRPKTHNNIESKQLKNCLFSSRSISETNSSIKPTNYNTSKYNFKKQIEKEEENIIVLNNMGTSILKSISKSEENESTEETKNWIKSNENNKSKQFTSNLQIDTKERNLRLQQNGSDELIEKGHDEKFIEVEESLCETEKSNNFLEAKNTFLKTKEKNEIILENVSKSKSSLQSHSSKDESIDHSCLSEKSSLCWSVITVSDSSLSDELSKTYSRKGDNKIVSGESRQLDCNFLTNIKSSKEEVMSNNSEICQNFKAENNTNSINEKGFNTNPNTSTKLGGVLAEQYEHIPQHSSQDKKIRSMKIADIDNLEKKAMQKNAYGSYTENDNVMKTCIMEQQTPLNDRDNIEARPQPNNEIYSHRLEDQINSSDSLSIDNELTIDEELNKSSSKELDTDEYNRDSMILTDLDKSNNDSASLNDKSTLLSNTLYNEMLSESLELIADEMLRTDTIVMSPIQKVKPKTHRKRKSDCLGEVIPCKRSQRLKAKQQMILEETQSLCKIPIEIGKYTKVCKNTINKVDIKSSIGEEDIKKKNLQTECLAIQNRKLIENENSLKMGFFRERDVEEEVIAKNDKQFNTIKQQKPQPSNSISTSNTAECQNQLSNCYNANEEEKQNHLLTIKCDQQEEKFYSQKDCISLRTVEKCIYSNSPQSPKSTFKELIYSDSPQSPASSTAAVETNNENILEIPLERLPQFMPQKNHQTLFDVLINTYKHNNQKLVFDSITSKEFKRQENILNQLSEQLNLFCYDEMELDLYCTSTHVINKLLSISPDCNLIQTAIINIAKKAEGTDVSANNLPSVIQEMPPQHLSKCLQRLFAFLRNMVTRNSDFCQELATKIENLLFKIKQIDNLSLQATLNLTQLYLMACKIQEYLQISKHPARLFIAKCLYFHLEKSALMIHEVLMWYPTVLPHREDTTYDRSDALISVIQQILMNTKYEMNKTDCRHRVLLSKLRYEYHFEPFKPSLDEVVTVLMEKLKNSKFYNICLAFGLLAKRSGISITENNLLNQKLLPLANDYFSLALQTNEYDKRIGVLLEVISMLVKTLPRDADVQKYFKEFSRFLNGFDRQPIQEAALCSILRLQRYNVEYCYNLLRHLQPTYTLTNHTQAMLKTFLYRRPLTFWKNLQKQNFIKFK